MMDSQEQTPIEEQTVEQTVVETAAEVEQPAAEVEQPAEEQTVFDNSVVEPEAEPERKQYET